jgi:uncharacterized cupredoxin-like copper-binding protein
MSPFGPAACGSWPPQRGLATAVAALLLLFTACGSSHSAATPRTNLIHVSERDFLISAPRQVSSGNLVLQVRNEGPDSHEFIMVRRNGRLPLRADGITIDEKALQGSEVGALEPSGVGSVRTLRLDLTPGHYQFFCNMAGHYMAGMHGEMVVR